VIPKLVVTSGEPAGIGPDILLAAAATSQPAQLVGLGDRALLAARARQLGLDVTLVPYNSTGPAVPHQPGELPLIDVPLEVTSHPGTLDPRNASQVLAQLDLAIELCRSAENVRAWSLRQCKRVSLMMRESLLAAIRNILRTLFT